MTALATCNGCFISRQLLIVIMMRNLLCMLFLCFAAAASGQVKWANVDTAFGELPGGLQVFESNDSLDGKPFRAFYAIADLADKRLNFTVDTTLQRRLTPTKFYEKNRQPLLVVNTTFFSFASNQNLNLVVKDGKMVGFNVHSIDGKGKDTLTYKHSFNGALGISKKRRADIAWIYSDSSLTYPLASQTVPRFYKDDRKLLTAAEVKQHYGNHVSFKKWKMQTAVAGGPVLLQQGEISVSNDEELKFGGKAINDKHPRTLIGYTGDNKIVVMVVEGRNPGIADGVTLLQAAKLLKELNCREGLNLDGGGSSCMLINGKPTIMPSDKGVQRPVPAVFIISRKG